jgi:hypothetical protein
MTPESINKMMYIPEMDDNNHTRFMTPKGSNIGMHQKGNGPGSARLDLKLGNTRTFYPYANPSKMNENLYSMGVFRNMMDTRNFSSSKVQNQNEIHKNQNQGFGGLNWFGSDQNSSHENQMTKTKTFLDLKQSGKSKKRLSLKEKYKLKVMANKQKNKEKKNQNETKDTVAPLSTESKTTLEKNTNERKDSHEKTDKKEKEKTILNKKKKEEKTTAKKKTVIINPNIVVNNFSFKCEPKNLCQENKNIFHNKISKETDPINSVNNLHKKESNFSLTNLKEHLSQESIEDGKLNIFRVFDHENSSEKNSLLNNSRQNMNGKEIDKYFKLKEHSQSEETCSKDSFKEFNFKMSSEDNGSEIETDIMETQQGRFKFSREYLEDDINDMPLTSFAEHFQDFQIKKTDLNQNPLDNTIKHRYHRNFRMEGVSEFTQQIPIDNMLTFHSKN